MFLTNPSAAQGKRLRVFEHEVEEIIKNKSVLILGSAPSVVNLKPEFMEQFDLITRINNFTVFNACKRTDIYYSFLGGSIKRTPGDLREGNCKLIFCKNPWEKVEGKSKMESLDFRQTYLFWRCHWMEFPYFVQTAKNWKWLASQIGQIVTTGLSAIVDIFRYQPSKMHLAGFHFFSSGLHNINIPCHFKRWPRHHDFKAEMLFAQKFISQFPNITVDPVMVGIFAEPNKFPKIGSKPE